MENPFEYLLNRINDVEDSCTEIIEILNKANLPNKTGNKDLIGIDEAAKLLGITKPTLYSKVSRRELSYMKRFNKLFFYKNDLIEYIEGGRVFTDKERKEMKQEFLKSQKEDNSNS